MADALLDTTFFIDLHRGDNGAVALWQEISDGSLSGSFSPITAFELWLSPDMSSLESDFYSAIFVFLEEAELSVKAATQAATWLRELSGPQAERLIRDALLAATAGLRSEMIYSRNLRDFRRFPVMVQAY